jgi:valacyclovir hydrolase
LQDAEDMACLMRALGHDAFAAVGWSNGANSAALLASLYPERVRKPAIWGGNSYISEDDIDRIEKVRSFSNWSARMRQTLGNIYGNDLQSIWSGYCDGLQTHYQAGGQICRDRLHLICCPTLILHGTLDPIVLDFHPRIFHQEIRGSRFHVFSEGCHNVHLALAGEFNTVVADLLLE